MINLHKPKYNNDFKTDDFLTIKLPELKWVDKNIYINNIKNKIKAKKEELRKNIDFKEYRILQRKYEDKKETIPQKIIKWINDTWDGQEIKTKEMLEHIGISQNQFDKAKEKNNDLKEILGQYMVKRGIYKKIN